MEHGSAKNIRSRTQSSGLGESPSRPPSPTRTYCAHRVRFLIPTGESRKNKKLQKRRRRATFGASMAAAVMDKNEATAADTLFEVRPHVAV